MLHGQAAKAVSQALAAMIGCLPGLRDVDAAIKSIANNSQKLVAGEVSACSEDGAEKRVLPVAVKVLCSESVLYAECSEYSFRF